MASVVQLLEWCTTLVADATDGHPNLDRAAQPDRDLLGRPPRCSGRPATCWPTAPARLPDLAALERQREASAAYHRSAAPDGDYDSVEIIARHAFHAQAIAWPSGTSSPTR